MHRARAASASLVVVALLRATGARADDLSSNDKLRAIYSAEFHFAADGSPLVPVAVAEGLTQVDIACDDGLRVLPDGEGGPEVRADNHYLLSVKGGAPARIRYWDIVYRGGPTDSVAAEAEAKAWGARGVEAHAFDRGTLFGVAGEVVDRREVVVGVGPYKSAEEAEAAAPALAKSAPGGKLAARGVHVQLAERPKGRVEAVGARTGIQLRNEGVMWFAPGGNKPIRVNEKSYFGTIYVAVDRMGTLTVVNALPADRLLAGLLPAEIYPQAPNEALKAQAVAARTEMLSKIGTRHMADPFRLCSTTHCQVYPGADKETPRTTAAVEATRGQVLFAGDGRRLADAFYSANSGGHTENNENVWPDMAPDPLLRGRLDAPGPRTATTGIKNVAAFLDHPPDTWAGRASLGKDRYRWTVTISAAELAKSLGADFGRITAIDALERGVSGRALAVRVVGEKKTDIIRGELRIRQSLGGLRSSLFTVKVADGAATFHGAGFGHGVGMCQTGAVGMAEGGKKYREILSHYYPGSVIRKLY